MKIKPLNDRVLVERLESENKTKGGIIIPDTAKEKPLEGRVVAVGTAFESSEDKKAPVKPGDHILFGKFAGTEITVDGVEQLILREEDILGIVEA